MQHLHLEGIVLRSVDYLNHKKIVTLFTDQLGMLAFVICNAGAKNVQRLNLITPLCKGEYILKKGKKELYSFQDGTILDMHLPIRQTYPHIQSALEIADTLLKMYMPNQPSKELYLLLCAYLKQIPFFNDPSLLSASFRLKLLIKEGLLHLSPTCNRCLIHPSSAFDEGESICTTCTNPKSWNMTPKEWHIINTLATARHFDLLQKVVLSSELKQQITTYCKYLDLK